MDILVQPDHASPRDRAYAHLKAALCGGGFRPGEAVRIIVVAAELRLSTTPVREALSRLAGEHLVDDRAREGFRMAALATADIADLYRVEAQLYVELAGGGYGAARIEAAATADTAAVIFRNLRRSSPARALSVLAEEIGARLAPYRREEVRVIEASAIELAALDAACRADRRADIRRQLLGYGRRRARLAEPLRAAAIATAPGNRPGNIV